VVITVRIVKHVQIIFTSLQSEDQCPLHVNT